MSSSEIKEAYRIFWMVKGHLNVSQSTVISCADGYFKRPPLVQQRSIST